MSAKFKYCVGGGELVIKDLKAQAGTYYDGQILIAGTGGVVTAADGNAASIIGVCNQDGNLPATSGYSEAGSTMGGGTGAVLTGTHALGTIENLKVIVNPDAVYAIEYQQTTPITWTAMTDTNNTFTTSSGDGYDNANIAGGWLWSYDTGALDYVVSGSNTTTVNTQVLVTGNDATSTTGIIIAPSRSGVSVPLKLNGGLTIAADSIDQGVAGTDGVNGIVLENRIESLNYGSEILDPVVHNRQVRYMNTNTSYKDKARIFAYVKFASVLGA
jgi:hypothetical protein